MHDIEIENIAEARRISRIGVRAIASGTLVALATLGLFLSLIGVYARTLDVHVVEHFGWGTYVWALISWVASASAGAVVAARVGHAARARDGALYGLVAWAAACVTGAVLLCTWYMAAVGVGIVSAAFGEALLRREVFGAYFAADLLALGGAVLAGVLATRTERRLTRAEREPTRAPQLGRTAPAT